MTVRAEPSAGHDRLGAILNGRPRRPSLFVATAALAAVLALARAADLLDRPRLPAPVEAVPTSSVAGPSAEAEPAGGAAEPDVDPPVSLDALLPVPSIEPGAGPGTPSPAAGGGDPLADVAAELARRGEELDRRERDLVLREAAAAAAARRLEEQLGRLEGMKKGLEELARRIRGEDDAELAQLVKTYEAMKARNAAQVFDQLALDILLPIVRRMREAKLAAVLAAMDPARAKQVTAALAQATPLPRLP